MSHKRPVTVLRRLWIGTTVIGFAAAVCNVPALYAQDPGAVTEAEDAPANDEAAEELRSAAGEPTGVFVAAPIGKVWVDPEFVDGEPGYVRRTRGKEGMAIVEVSSTPFMPEATEVAGSVSQSPELPASW